MIKEKNQSKIDNKSNKLDTNIKPNNKKGLFHISSDNSSLNYSTIIPSPDKNKENNQKLDFNFSKKYSKNNTYIFSKYPNNNNKNNEKSINMSIHNSDNMSENKNNDIGVIIDDQFFDLLVNIYKNEGIEIGFEDDNDISENKNDDSVNDDLKENTFKIDANIYNYNNNEINNEQISCICLKSKCLNNYCSCHKNGIWCNTNCRCANCENNSNNPISSNELKNNNNICKNKNSKFFSL